MSGGPCQNTIYQNGKEVYKFAVHIMGEAAAQAVESVGLKTTDVDLFIPHQANIRIIQKAAERMGLPMEKVFVNLDRTATRRRPPSRSRWTRPSRRAASGPADLVVLVGFGAGLTWGANVLRWNAERISRCRIHRESV